MSWFSLAGAIGGGLINSISSLFGANKQQRFQKELLQIQNDMAIENWERENEYNTPEKQLERLRDAGLNPHLLYGNGQTAVTSNGSIDTPQMSASDVGKYYAEAGRSVGSILGNYLQHQQIRANLRKTDAESSAVETQTDFTKQQILSSMHDRQIKLNEELRKQDKHPFEKKLLQEQIDSISKSIEKIEAETLWTEQQTNYSQQESKRRDNYLQLAINEDRRASEKLASSLKVDEATAKNYFSQAQLAIQNAKNGAEALKEIQERTRLTRTQAFELALQSAETMVNSLEAMQYGSTKLTDRQRVYNDLKYWFKSGKSLDDAESDFFEFIDGLFNDQK